VTAPPEHDALAGYASTTYDDAVTPAGDVRPAARPVMDAVLHHDLAALGRAVHEEVDTLGIRFSSVDGDDSWHVDPVPRVIEHADWQALAAGLEQRVRALNAFVADVYGPRRIVAEGALPEHVLDTADGLEPEMAELGPADGVWIGVAGLDIVRDGEGTWLVLEDNVRTPSGLGYWSAARDAVLRHLDVAPEARPAPLDGVPGALRTTLGPGSAAVLTDGPGNSAFWEHEWLAEAMGVPAVTTDDLEVRDGRLWHEGAAIDAVYRRSDEDRLDTPLGRFLHPVLAAGALKMVNCFGTGIADDKLAHAHVPDIIRFYLREEPLLDQVETFDLSEPETLERALDVFDELVIKDRSSYGGKGVVVCPHADPADVEELREQVRANPGEYIAQRLVELSTHPTVIDGRLEPRHVDLRPFVVMHGAEEAHALPGGITRVALGEGALVVNSSQNGGAKDTWVLP
jgi:uncharacterized circularly permuted ATP-grasp superfamily protein